MFICETKIQFIFSLTNPNMVAVSQLFLFDRNEELQIVNQPSLHQKSYILEHIPMFQSICDQYINQDSKLLAPVIYFAEPVKTNLWNIGRSSKSRANLRFKHQLFFIGKPMFQRTCDQYIHQDSKLLATVVYCAEPVKTN